MVGPLATKCKTSLMLNSGMAAVVLAGAYGSAGTANDSTDVLGHRRIIKRTQTDPT